MNENFDVSSVDYGDFETGENNTEVYTSEIVTEILEGTEVTSFTETELTESTTTAEKPPADDIEIIKSGVIGILSILVFFVAVSVAYFLFKLIRFVF